jgi:NADPH2:quinone reductase
MRTGAFAEEAVVQAHAIEPLPAAFSFEEGATFRVGFKTAYNALVRCGRLQAGETVLVHGASGGVGMGAVVLAKRLGAKVIATGGRPEKLAAVAAAGADHVVDLSSQDLRDTVLGLTGGKGVEVIYDPVGGDLFAQSLRCAAYGARVLVVGFASGAIPEVAVNRILIKGLTVHGIRAGEFGRNFPDLGRADTRALAVLAADGSLRPHVSVRLPLAEAAKALTMLQRREVVGRVALIV